MTAVNPEALDLLWDDAFRMASARRRIPTATYRLQMHAGFTLRDALNIVPYLDRLGISHLYVSSLLTARPGSLHGYDVVNHSHLNPELGTEEDLAALVTQLRSRHMGLILDVVPNHMWVGEDNEWWMDVLENGPTSRFAGYFDIAWRNHPRERLRGKVLLPILDEPYGKAIQAGRLRPFFEQGRFGIRIDQTRLPLDPRTYAAFLEPALESFRAQQGEETPAVLELQSILTAVRHLPPRDDTDANHVSEALAEGLVIKRRLRELVEQNPEVEAHFDQAVRDIAGTRDQPAGFTRLIELLDAQAYRPCFWRVALDEINYRRFFDVNDLAALAAECIDVFHAIHVKPFEWLRNGILDGLRIDHVDGLLDPTEYLNRLQQHYVLGCARKLWESNRDRYGGDTWPEVEGQLLSRLETGSSPGEQLLYVVIEKILGPRELLPTTWACNGTTGYEFLNAVNDLFVDPQRVDALTVVYQRFTGQTDAFEQIAYERKLQVLRSTMASELHVLAHRLDRLAQAEWWTRDFTLNGLRHALEEIIACFPVYRTYVSHEASASDRVIIQRAARRARMMSPLLGREIFDFICDTLSLREPQNGPASEEYRAQQRKFTGKFQQLTSPVMAKGVEDTALYIFNRLLSLNEVGGEPAKFGRTPQELHTFLRNRAAMSLGGLSPLSTHDTKRSEDIRARINVLSEMPEEWGRRIERWRRLNRPLRVELEEGVVAPDDNEEYFLYQTLIGAWPGANQASHIDSEFIKRIQAYMTKAIREAKVHSSWIHPQLEYDHAVSDFIAAILNADLAAAFMADLREFLTEVHALGTLNSLSQTLVRCTAPGVPDTYQGTESWDDSLVDPDNRRPVDYASRIQLLDRVDQIQHQRLETRSDLLWRELKSGGAKLLVTSQALRLRREHLVLFQTGHYTPLETDGPDAQHLFGFLMNGSAAAVLVAVPRLLGTLNGKGKLIGSELRVTMDADLILPDEWANRWWSNVFTGVDARCHSSRLSATTLFSDFPVALLRTTPHE